MKSICTAFFLALIIASCSRVPDETMDGRGTFYCKVNGEDYFPDCNSFACQDVRAAYSTFGDAVGISALRDDGNRFTYIYIAVYNISTGPSIINVNDPDSFLDNTSIFQECGDTFLEDESDFEIKVTKLDLDEKIISGTFSGVFSRVEPNHNCTDTIVLTDGIFDLPITF